MNTATGALLIDLDGVLRRWPHVDTGLPPGVIEGVAFAPALADAVLTGAITDADWRSAIVQVLAEEYGPRPSAQAVEAWSQFGVLDEDVVRLIRQVRERAPVWLATNATSRLPVDLAMLGLDRDFDGVVNSSAVGAAKPAEEFLHSAIALSGPVSLFVDDSEKHCSAAAAFGLPAHRFETAPGLQRALREAHLID